MTRPGHATYLYCLLHRAEPPRLASMPRGLAGMARPRALRITSRLYLIVADAPLGRYGAAAINGRLHDLDWVSACALAHEAVVEHAASLGTAVPMKLFTLFSSEDRALRHMRGRRRALAAVIRRIAGRQEWGVRVRADVKAATNGQGRVTRRAVSGTQFLLRKQRDAAARRRRATPASAPVRRALGALGRDADGAKRRAIPAAASRVSGLVADVVYLVPTRGRARFLHAVTQARRALARQGYDLALTGPWPPYHFIPGSR
jgi:Gas vesicle synthesis protein GvpL/GvpF